MINWEIDAKHSEIHFMVKHMLISTVTDLFTKFTGKAITEDARQFSNGQVNISIDVASVYTNETYRDEHLKSPGFFDIDEFPAITFTSTAFNTTQDNDQFSLQGLLSIKNITKEITLQVIYGGYATHNRHTRVGFQVSGTINRRDFGLSYNPLMEAGGMIVSENVDILANIELIKQ